MASASSNPQTPDRCYVEVAEDGSADRYCETGADIVTTRSWPAGTAPATGAWTFCPDDAATLPDAVCARFEDQR